MTNKLLLVLIWIMLIVCSCSIENNQNSEVSDENKENITRNNWIGKSLVLPDSVFSMLNNKETLKEFYLKNKEGYTLIGFVESSCLGCINLTEWEKFLSYSKIEEKANIIFIVSKEREAYLSFLIFDQIKFKYNVFFDQKDLFFSQNKLDEKRDNHIFLVKNDGIILTGNSVFDENEHFRNQILDFLK